MQRNEKERIEGRQRIRLSPETESRIKFLSTHLQLTYHPLFALNRVTDSYFILLYLPVLCSRAAFASRSPRHPPKFLLRASAVPMSFGVCRAVSLEVRGEVANLSSEEARERGD